MAGWSEGFVIPKIDGYAPVYDGEVLAGLGVHNRTEGVDKGSDSRSHVRAEYSLIYRARCIYCKSFHKPTSYCFRLNRQFTSTMARGRRHRQDSDSSSADSMEEGERSDSSESSDDVSDRDGGVDALVEGAVGQQDGFGPPFDIDLTEFYKKKRRVDAPEIKLVLRKETINLYFEELLSHGKLDKESALVLSKKYYMGEEAFNLLAPPTLNDTKLHCIQPEAGGIYNRLLSIHVAVRNALKIFLRVYESLGGCSQAFGDYQPLRPYTDSKELVDEFSLLSLAEARESVSDNDVNEAIPESEEAWKTMLRDKLAMEKLIERNASVHVKLVSELDDATAVASLGKAQHGALVDLLGRFLFLTSFYNLHILVGRVTIVWPD